MFVAAWFAVLTPGASADQLACGQVIRASTTITNSVFNCAGDGLVIGAGGITVDLNGQTIEGTGLGVGVRNDGHADVTIRNGTLRNFDYGVVLNPGTVRNSVTGLSLVGNEWASIGLNNAGGNHLGHNRISEFSDVAVHLANGSSGNMLTRNAIVGGNGEGFVIEGGSNLNRVESNVVLTSSDRAMRVDSSSNTMVLGNELSGSSDVAVEMIASPGSVVQANTIGEGGDAGVLLTDGTANVVRFNAFGQTGDAGVILSSVTNSLVKANSMRLSGDAAIIVREGSSDIRVIDNHAGQSSDAGIFIADGRSNTVRGNTLVSNAVGIEVSGGQGNRLEFNAANTSLGVGIEIASSGRNTVFGNTLDQNGQGGIWVEESILTNVTGNAARWNSGDGIEVSGDGSVVRSNLARNNHKWGIYAAPGVFDGGGNGASGNGEGVQCYLIACSDGSDWIAPVRPPEPLDPLEIGLPDMSAVDARRLRAGLSRDARRGTVGVVKCKRRRVAEGADDVRRPEAKAVCRAPYRARPRSRSLAGRLVRNGKSFASGARRVRAGRPGSLAMHARTRPRSGRYLLVLSFRDGGRHDTVVRRMVRVR